MAVHESVALSHHPDMRKLTLSTRNLEMKLTKHFPRILHCCLICRFISTFLCRCTRTWLMQRFSTSLCCSSACLQNSTVLVCVGIQVRHPSRSPVRSCYIDFVFIEARRLVLSPCQIWSVWLSFRPGEVSHLWTLPDLVQNLLWYAA